MKSVLNVGVSQFDGYKKPFAPVTVNLLDWLFDESHRQSVEQIRKRDFTNSLEMKKLKESLPAVTISGIFEQRLNEGLIKHSGLICIDIDAKDNTECPFFKEMKEMVSSAPFVAYCGFSISGEGYFVIIPILYPEKHKQHFKALKELFAKAGIIIDVACKDVSRLRGCSWDDTPYINHDAKPFSCIIEDIPRQPIKPHTTYRPDGDDNRSWVERYINEINTRNIDVAPDYKIYRNIGFAFAQEFGEAGRDLFHSVCSPSHKYKFDDTEKHYSNFLKSRSQGKVIKIGSFFHYCRQTGITFRNDRQSLNDYYKF